MVDAISQAQAQASASAAASTTPGNTFSPIALWSNMLAQAVLNNRTATATGAVAAGYAFGGALATATSAGLLEANVASRTCNCGELNAFLLGGTLNRNPGTTRLLVKCC